MTRKSCRAEVKVTVRGPAARSIYSALEPDMKKLEGRDRLAMSLQRSSIFFKIQTDDLASLRANVNSYLRLVDASYRCISVK